MVDADPFPKDSSGHGSATAGIMAGRPTADWAGGLCPSARLYSASVIEEGSRLIRILLGLHWLLNHPVQVVNISVGVQKWNPILRPLIHALRQKDVLVVGVIGNDGAGCFRSPGAYPEVLCVGSTGADGKVSKFSGSRNLADTECLKPDLVACGEGWRSAKKGGGYKIYSGTSFATAFVSATAALLRQAAPGASAGQIAQAMIQTALPLAASQKHRSKSGCIQPLQALDLLRSKDEVPAWNQHSILIEKEHFRDPALSKELKYCPPGHFTEIILHRSPGQAPGIEEVLADTSGKKEIRRLRFLKEHGYAIALATKAQIEKWWTDDRIEMISNGVGEGSGFKLL